jgi:glutaredoxin 3
MANKTIKIYSTPTCHYCNIAKDFFKEKGLKYEEYNVGIDLEKRKEMVDKSSQMGVPVIDIDGDIVIGFDENQITKLLNL